MCEIVCQNTRIRFVDGSATAKTILSGFRLILLECGQKALHGQRNPLLSCFVDSLDRDFMDAMCFFLNQRRVYSLFPHGQAPCN